MNSLPPQSLDRVSKDVSTEVAQADFQALYSQDGAEFLVVLPLPLKCWHFRCAPP